MTMTFSFTTSTTETFTATHAKHISAKVAADLKRMQRFYGYPDDADIGKYEAELIAFLKSGYLGTVTYGYRRGGKWVEPTLQYTARDLAGMSAGDDDPGRIRPGLDVAGASFYSYLTYSSSYSSANSTDKEDFEKSLPFQRGGAEPPGINGYLAQDRTYSSGGRALERYSVRSN